MRFIPISENPHLMVKRRSELVTMVGDFLILKAYFAYFVVRDISFLIEYVLVLDFICLQKMAHFNANSCVIGTTTSTTNDLFKDLLSETLPFIHPEECIHK